jgi:hypothetical protein
MKVIIAGSRSIASMEVVEQAIKESGFEITQVVSGLARGVDTLGLSWGKKNSIHGVGIPADWGLFGRSAGLIRNQEMADYADALIAIWDGKSRGTKDMIDRATKKGLKVYVKTI